MYHVTRSLGNDDVYVCEGRDPLWECPDPGTTCCMTGTSIGTCLPTDQCAMLYDYCNTEQGRWSEACGGSGAPPATTQEDYCDTEAGSIDPACGAGYGTRQPESDGSSGGGGGGGSISIPGRTTTSARPPYFTDNEKLMIIGGATLSILGLLYLARG